MTLAALVVGLVVLWQLRPIRQPAHAARAQIGEDIRAEIHADPAAVWSKDPAEGNRQRVVLTRGTLWIHVDHAAEDPAEDPAVRGRFQVVLPDGELEDTGTTFTVSAEDGHTKRVAVEEGSVVLRVRGQAPVAIGAGETWIANAPASIPPSGPASINLRSVPLPVPSPSAKISAPARSGPRARAPMPLAAAAVPDPSVAFRAATVALDAGDNVEAAAAFARFVVRYPRDPRAEDAAYLRVLALQRCGAAGDMRRAAQEYLLSYPAGFRHAEVERLFR
jgi:hypothetical protein